MLTYFIIHFKYDKTRNGGYWDKLICMFLAPSSEGGIIIATQFRHFALCVLHFALHLQIIIHPTKSQKTPQVKGHAVL